MSIQSGTSPGAIISAGVSPVDGVSSVFGRTGAVVAVSGDYDSDEITNVSDVPGTTVSDALNAAGTYYWVWADAAERLAEVVTAAQIGGIGYQTDIAREYKLLALTGGAPHRWGELVDSKLAQARLIVSRPGSTTPTGVGTTDVFISGVAVARTIIVTNVVTGLMRVAIPTTAVAGTVGNFGFGGINGPLPGNGYRFQGRCVLGAVSANWRWFFGLAVTSAATNVNPNTFLNCIGIGRGAGETNVQLFHNDGSGVATQIDLGVNYPADTVNNGFEFQVYTIDATSFMWQIRNLLTSEERSGIIVGNTPTPSALMGYRWYSTNNTDATIVSLDVVDCSWAQITR